jgi:glycosyltransferase involved in cell wall biosynthesis
VNGEWEDQPLHVHSFYNPSLHTADRNTAAEFAMRKKLTAPYRFLFVGRVESAKGAGTVLEIVSQLRESNLPFHLDLIGDGPQKVEFKKVAEALQLNPYVHFHGWLPRSGIDEFYRQAHFILLPSSSEGWPKVLSEGMAYGVVPIASNVSSIPQILAKCGTGVSLPAHAVSDFVSTVLDYINNPARWENERNAGLAAATRFTFESYLESIRKMFHDEWGLSFTAMGSESLKNAVAG